MRISRILLLASLIATESVRAQGLPSAPPASIGLSPSALARIAPALNAYVDSGKIAGAVAIIARHGKVGYSETIGLMDVEHGTPMRADAVFRIYSMTKPVIATAVLKLVEQGKLRLDDPVAKFIPAFSTIHVYAGGPSANPTLRAPSRPVTIEHLLTHTSGLTYGAVPGLGLQGRTPAVDSIYDRATLLNPARTVRQLADSIARLPLAFSPGDAWNYSLAIDVLGAVIEVASGTTLDKYLDNEIFAPLGMRATSFHATPAMDGRIAVLYSRGPDGALHAPAQLLTAGYLPTGRLFSGGAGLLSTPADYLRFAQMLLNGGELDGHRVLSRASVTNMMRNHLPPSLTPIAASVVAHSGYGFGFGGAVLVNTTHATVPGSPGIYRWWGIAGTFFWIDPKNDLIGMVWTQLMPSRADPLELEFQRLVYGAVER